MKILANQHLFKIDEILPDGLSPVLFDPARFPENAPEYDALLINTTTKIDDSTLPDAGNLKFIATGSAGDDHVDKEHLDKLGIKFANAAGCNARSVAEYVITALLIYADKKQISTDNLKIGILGCGNTGQAVAEMLDSLSIPKIEYDPPREFREKEFKSAHFEELFRCNVLTFHTPLNKGGNYPSYHLLNDVWFYNRNFDLVINCARGGVVDEQSLIHSLTEGNLGGTVLDVWENEPLFSDTAAKNSLFSTPHIAGYSIQSKLRASQMIATEMCEFFGITPANVAEPESEKIIFPEEVQSLSEILKLLHPIAEYDSEFRKLLNLEPEKKSDQFYKLRTGFPLRNEFSSIKIERKWIEKFPVLEKLGIDIL